MSNLRKVRREFTLQLYDRPANDSGRMPDHVTQTLQGNQRPSTGH